MPWVWWVLTIYTSITTVYVATDWRYVQPKPFVTAMLVVFWIVLVTWFIKVQGG